MIIPKAILYTIGFTSQILFSARTLVQWLKSERAKKVLAPELFWKLSLAASFLLFVYGLFRSDFAIMLGQSITYFIYIRNMQLQGSWTKLKGVLRCFLILFPFFSLTFLYTGSDINFNTLFKNENIPLELLIWGSAGQVIFSLRFVYQWIYSEKAKISTLPFGFWMISLVGSFIILTYGVFRKDPVLIVGQLFGFIVYLRNILLGKREDKYGKDKY